MNKWIGIGRLVADPEVRYSKDNKAVARYRLAVDRQFNRKVSRLRILSAVWPSARAVNSLPSI